MQILYYVKVALAWCKNPFLWLDLSVLLEPDALNTVHMQKHKQCMSHSCKAPGSSQAGYLCCTSCYISPCFMCVKNAKMPLSTDLLWAHHT